VPSWDISEHPPSSVSAGQSFVTSVVNAVMNSPQWSSTAIFLAWDDWGGHYDHVVPPTADENGYGLRVPGIIISPYATHGYINHAHVSAALQSRMPNGKAERRSGDRGLAASSHGWWIADHGLHDHPLPKRRRTSAAGVRIHGNEPDD